MDLGEAGCTGPSQKETKPIMGYYPQREDSWKEGGSHYLSYRGPTVHVSTIHLAEPGPRSGTTRHTMLGQLQQTQEGPSQLFQSVLGQQGRFQISWLSTFLRTPHPTMQHESSFKSSSEHLLVLVFLVLTVYPGHGSGRRRPKGRPSEDGNESATKIRSQAQGERTRRLMATLSHTPSALPSQVLTLLSTQ